MKRKVKRITWLEIGVLFAMLSLPFLVKGGGGPEQMIIPDIIINPPAPEISWMTHLVALTGVLVGGVSIFIAIAKWLKGRKETDGRK